MDNKRRSNLMHDLFFPVLLFAALGGMTWAVRGSSGFGAVKGCVFAGVMWGAAWWFLARDPSGPQSRRYASAWIILAVTVGIGLAGARGWMQWPSFFVGQLQIESSSGRTPETAPISPIYGFVWLFIAGVPWAGLGACMLAWCGSLHRTRAWEWVLRIGCGFGAAFLANYLFLYYPQFFLPLYKDLGVRYDVFLEMLRNGGHPGKEMADYNLFRLINDNNNAVRHMGFFLGFLLFEVSRRDWKNVGLIGTVGLVNGIGWALCQNWKWAQDTANAFWPTASFNFWRCWESSGGISIGIAFGLAYFLVNRRMSDEETALAGTPWPRNRLNFEWLIAPLLLFAIGWTLWRRLPVQVESIIVEMPWLTINKDTMALIFACFGIVYIAGFAAYLFQHLKRHRAAAEENAPPFKGWSNLDWVAGCLLIVPLAWFMRSQLSFEEYRAMLDAPSWMRFLDFGNVYFAIGVFYALACLAYLAYFAARRRKTEGAGWFDPGFEWFAIYLGLLVTMGFFFAGEFGRWTSPEQEEAWGGGWLPVIFHFVVVAALFAVVYYIRSFTLGRDDEYQHSEAAGYLPSPNLEWFGAYAGLILGLGLSIKNGSRGWANVYIATEEFSENYYGQIYWNVIGPLMLLCLVALSVWIIIKPLRKGFRGDVFPHAYGLVWVVLIVQNVIAQLITGPYTSWNEVAFNIYYVLLFLISVAVVYHFHFVKTHISSPTTMEPHKAFHAVERNVEATAFEDLHSESGEEMPGSL